MVRASKFFGMLILSLCGLSVSAGEIAGVVEDHEGIPVSQMLVRLQGPDWTTWAYTDQAGSFAFKNLPTGRYLCDLQPNPSFEIEEPPCGYYLVDLNEGDLFNLPFAVARTTGVSVEFGTPSGNNGSGIIPVNGNQFTISIFGNGLAGANPAYRRMVIKGYWTVPGQGTINVLPGGSQSAGNYVNSGIGVSVSVANDGLATIIITNYSSPYLAYDGELAQIDFTLDLPPFALDLPDYLVFCIEDVTLWTEQDAVSAVGQSYVGTPKAVRARD